MSITQFANSIRSSETTVQLLKDELRKEHETAANYLKEVEAAVYRELDNVERFLQAGMDENMDPNKEVLKPRIDFYGADIDRAIIRVSPNDYVNVDLSPIVTNIHIDLKEKIGLAKPDGDIMRAINAIAVLRAAIVDTLKERNERRLAISVYSDAVSFSVYIDADGEKGNPKDVHRQLAEYIGERPSFGMGSMIVDMLESM